MGTIWWGKAIYYCRYLHMCRTCVSIHVQFCFTTSILVLALTLSHFLTFYENIYLLIKVVYDSGCYWLSTQILYGSLFSISVPPFGFSFYH